MTSPSQPNAASNSGDASAPDAVHIRAATAADSPALSHICLLTAASGHSAEDRHTIRELPGLQFAEPYVHLPTTFGFVLVDPRVPAPHDVVGYILSSYDTRAYEAHAEQDWYPPLREKYPRSLETFGGCALTEYDKQYIGIIHTPPLAGDVQLAFSPAHMHINILPAYQRQGWGRRLLAHVVRYLREERGLDRLWLGIDPKNEAARRFYERLGFKDLEGAPNGTLGLAFDDFKE